MSSGPQRPEQPETLWELASVCTAQPPGICKVQIPGAAGPGGLAVGLGFWLGWVSACDPDAHSLEMEPKAWGWRPSFSPAPRLLSGSELPAPAPQAFTSGLRRYLQYYRACVLSTPPTLSLLTIGFLFKKLGRQLRSASVCDLVAGEAGMGHAGWWAASRWASE